MHKEDALAQTKEYKGNDTADSKDQKASKPYLALIPLLMLVGGVVLESSTQEVAVTLPILWKSWVQVIVILPCSGEVYYP